MSVELLTEHHLEFLGFKGGFTGSSESTHVKIPHCWKSHVAAHLSHNMSFPTMWSDRGTSDGIGTCLKKVCYNLSVTSERMHKVLVNSA